MLKGIKKIMLTVGIFALVFAVQLANASQRAQQRLRAEQGDRDLQAALAMSRQEQRQRQVLQEQEERSLRQAIAASEAEALRVRRAREQQQREAAEAEQHIVAQAIEASRADEEARVRRLQAEEQRRGIERQRIETEPVNRERALLAQRERLRREEARRNYVGYMGPEVQSSAVRVERCVAAQQNNNNDDEFNRAIAMSKQEAEQRERVEQAAAIAQVEQSEASGRRVRERQAVSARATQNQPNQGWRVDAGSMYPTSPISQTSVCLTSPLSSERRTSCVPRSTRSHNMLSEQELEEANRQIAESEHLYREQSEHFGGVIKLDDNVKRQLPNLVQLAGEYQADDVMCGYHTLGNADAINILLAANREITNHTIQKTRQENPIREPRGDLFEEEVLDEIQFNDVERTYVITQPLLIGGDENHAVFIRGTKHEVPVNLSSRDGRLKLRQYLDAIRIAEKPTAIHFIVHKAAPNGDNPEGQWNAGHWVLLSAVARGNNQPLQFVYIDSKQTPLTQENLAFEPIKNLVTIVNSVWGVK